jgi:carbon monoxide dehydrogenase subunit G
LKIEGTYTINAPRERVYQMLRDPSLLQGCIPGAQTFEAQGNGRYTAVIQAGIAAIKGTFNGVIEIADENPPNSYTLRVEGSGGPGFVKGTAHISLSDDGNATKVAVDGDGQVGGMIAGVGQRMLLPAARVMMNQFFGCMGSKIEAGNA